MKTRFVLGAAALALSVACSSNSNSPTSATAVTIADFNGTYTGTYNITNCSESGQFAGFCAAGVPAGTSLPIFLTLTQTGGTVSGTLTLGSVTGTFQGTVSGTTLTGTASLSFPSDDGFTLTISVSNWNTTISGNAMSGQFTLVFGSPAISGNATIAASIAQLNR
jgi:hypothetical protein